MVTQASIAYIYRDNKTCMLQRIQTLWLLLASICAFLTVRFPFYSGTKTEGGVSQPETLVAGTNFFLLVGTVAVALLSLITIFLYKNRKLQFRLCLLALLLQIGCIALYFSLASSLSNGVMALWSLFSFAVPLLLILAARGIYRDQKLIKSADRLR